jgi:hypothetical protein
MTWVKHSQMSNHSLVVFSKAMVLLVVTISMTFVSSGFGQASDIQDLSVRIELDRTGYEPNDPLNLVFTLENVSDQHLTVLKWLTPLEGLLSDIFVILYEGDIRVRYIGPLVKRVVSRLFGNMARCGT